MKKCFPLHLKNVFIQLCVITNQYGIQYSLINKNPNRYFNTILLDYIEIDYIEIIFADSILYQWSWLFFEFHI